MTKTRPPKKDTREFQEMSERPPELLKSSDVLDLRNQHQKELFHGYFRARWGFMEEFNQMYNEGLALFSSKKISISLVYMEKFLSIMRDTYYPGEEPNEYAIFPRTFDVTYTRTILGDNPPTQITMSIAQVCRNWPEISTLIDKPGFTTMKFEVDQEIVEIERLPEIVIEPL